LVKIKWINFIVKNVKKLLRPRERKKNGKARFMEFVGGRSLNALFARVKLKKLKR